MTTEEFAQHYPFFKTLKAGFCIWKISRRELKNTAVCASKTHSMLFVFKGRLYITIGTQKIALEDNSFIDVFDIEQFGITRASEDIDAYQVIIYRTFILDLFKNKPPFPVSYFVNNRGKQIKMTDTRFAVVEKYLKLIYQLMDCTEHTYHYQMIQNAANLLFSDLGDIFVKLDYTNPVLAKSDRKREIFTDFVKLCHTGICQHHTIQHYAKELNITPQYFVRVVKEVAQMTVYEFLQKAMVGKIVKRLNEPDKSIQEIADELSFTDQATFTKFFKRLSSESPSEYKKRNR